MEWHSVWLQKNVQVIRQKKAVLVKLVQQDLELVFGIQVVEIKSVQKPKLS
jgi:hypothetical protein